MSTKRRLLSALTLILMASLAGCGGGGGDATDPPTAGAPAPAPAPGPAPSPAPATATVSLAWTAPSDSRVVGYRVYYGTASQSYLQSFGAGLNAGGTPALTIRNLQANTRYYFAVTSYDAASNESGYSAEVSKVVN